MEISTLVILGILTILIFALTLFAFSSIYGRAKEIVDEGKKDNDILQKFKTKKKFSILSLLGTIVEIILLLVIISLGALSIIYQKNNDTLFINGKTFTVIASDSMVGENEDNFNIGDIGVFETVDENQELTKYEVYGYKTSKGKIIIHRLITIDGDNLTFKGDNAKKADSVVNRDKVLFHFTGTKIEYVGNFVLFIKSVLGLFTLICIVIIYILSEIYLAKYNKLLKQRYDKLKNLPVNTTVSSNFEIESTLSKPEQGQTLLNLSNNDELNIDKVIETIKNKQWKTNEPPAPLEDGFTALANQLRKEAKTAGNQVEPRVIQIKFEKLTKYPGAIADFYRTDGTHVIIYPKESGKKSLCIKPEK